MKKILALCFALASFAASAQTIPPTQFLHVDTRALLSDQIVTKFANGDPAYVEESGQQGIFQWSTSDQSAAITSQGGQIGANYVAPDSDADGSSGAWVRSLVRIPDGSASTPSLSFAGDPNTGLFWVSADILGFATGGASLWQMNSAGHLFPTTDNTPDIGSATNRPRQVFAGTNIQLGHASDTTITRGSAGHLAVEGQTVWDAANDGSGSTLDADLLDGSSSAAFQAADSDLTSWAGVTRASGFDTFAATPSSANLASLLTDEAGSGAAYFTGGALGTPASGTATNLTGLPIATGVAGLGSNVAAALATPSSANVAAAVTDETGTGALAFANAPDLVAPVDIGTPTSALTTIASSADLYTASTSNVKWGAENTSASGSAAGSLIGVYSNDGAAMASGDRLGGILLGGSSSASAIRNTAAVTAFADAAWTDAASYSSRIDFETTPTGSTTRAAQWRISNSGSLLAVTDNTDDIGASGATRPRDVYVADDIEIGGDLDVSGATASTITCATGDCSIEGVQITRNTGTQTLTNKTLTAPVINGAVTGTMTVPQEAYTDAGWNGDAAAADRDSVRDVLVTGRSAFRAYSNAGEGSYPDNAGTQDIVIDTEVFDQGSKFASNVWTPEAGVVTVGGCSQTNGTFAAAGLARLWIYKDADGAGGGAAAALLPGDIDNSASTSFRVSCVTAIDLADGTATYSLRYVADVSSGTNTIIGGANTTFFYGALQ